MDAQPRAIRPDDVSSSVATTPTPSSARPARARRGHWPARTDHGQDRRCRRRTTLIRRPQRGCRRPRGTSRCARRAPGTTARSPVDDVRGEDTGVGGGGRGGTTSVGTVGSIGARVGRLDVAGDRRVWRSRSGGPPRSARRRRRSRRAVPGTTPGSTRRRLRSAAAPDRSPTGSSGSRGCHPGTRAGGWQSTAGSRSCPAPPRRIRTHRGSRPPIASPEGRRCPPRTASRGTEDRWQPAWRGPLPQRREGEDDPSPSFARVNTTMLDMSASGMQAKPRKRAT